MNNNVMVEQLISIIVPVYNVEQYLCSCLDSILCQTYKNFELIVVDDGSTDTSKEICDRYQKKDNRVHVIHKENGGVSSARNIGIKRARGEWISFVDSDDWVQENYLEELLKGVHSDLVIGNFQNSQTKVNHDSIASLCNYNLYRHDLTPEILRKLLFFPWCKLFRTEILKKNKILFDEHLRLSEDTHLNIKYLLHCSTVTIIESNIYNYRKEIVPHNYYLTDKEMLYHVNVLKIAFHDLRNYKRICCNKIEYEIYAFFFYSFKDYVKSSKTFKDFVIRTDGLNKESCEIINNSLINESFLKKKLYKFLFTFRLLGYYVLCVWRK